MEILGFAAVLLAIVLGYGAVTNWLLYGLQGGRGLMLVGVPLFVMGWQAFFTRNPLWFLVALGTAIVVNALMFRWVRRREEWPRIIWLALGGTVVQIFHASITTFILYVGFYVLSGVGSFLLRWFGF